MNLLSPDTLDAERWRRIDSVLDVVLDAAPLEVPALLEALCAGHPELRREIEALLEADRASEGLMASPAAMLIDVFSDDAPPARVGRYVVTGTLGQGGMGVVLDARDDVLGRRVALKSLPAALASDPERLERFLCEARLLATLQDPHLAGFLGIAREGDRRWLVLEHVAGVTLADRFEAGPLGVPEALDILAQVAQALAAVHALGIVHRDLKPSNVMITPGGIVKLLDLGLAEGDGGGGAFARAGTPGWMSPEQIRGETQDARTDVFAWGALAWQALTGEPAFPGRDASERFAATFERELDVAALPAPLPIALRATLLAALSRDPSRRPADGAAVLAVLERAPVEAAAGEGGLIGRARELALARSLLSRARLVTLTGGAGVGKTRLARELATGAAHTLWVDATACTDLHSLVAAIAAAGGLRVTDETALPAALAAAHREPTVLVVDGPDGAMAACATLVPALLEGAPNLRVLVAARGPLRAGGEEQLRLTPFEVPDDEMLSPSRLRGNDAVRLFLATARRVAPGAAIADADLLRVAGIVRALEGVPLAIELAAARIADEPLGTIADELAAGASAGDAVRVAIEASLAKLEPEALRFLRALGVFRGGFDLGMAAAVATEDDDRFGALDSLAQLLERALVTIARADRSEPRYRLLEPVRRAAQARAEAAGESHRLGVRHRQAYLAAAERLAPALTGGAEQSRALAWLEAEHENVLAAIAFDAGPGDDPELALQLAGAAWWFWYVRGHFARGRAALDLVLARPGAGAPTPARATSLLGAGALAYTQGDRVAGRARSLEAVAAFDALGERLGIARALTGVALCDADDGRHAEAAAGYLRAIAIFRELGEVRRLAATLTNLGVLERLREDFRSARTHHAEALDALRATDDRDATIVTLLNLALADTRLEARAAAADHLSEALTLIRGLRARRSGPSALEVAAEWLADDELAARLLGAAAGLRRAIALPAGAWWRQMTEARALALERHLGAATFTREFTRGESLRFEDALAAAQEALEASRTGATR